MSGRRVVVCGLGMRGAAGLDVTMCINALRAGVTRLQQHPFLIDRRGNPMVMHWATYLDEDLPYSERLFQLAAPALRACLRPLAEKLHRDQAVPLLWSVPTPRPGLPDDLLAALARLGREPDLPLDEAAVEWIRLDHVGGLVALEKAAQNIRAGRWDCAVVGGVDSYFSVHTLEWLDRENRLLSPANSYGFPPGEGAAFALLADTQTARRFNLPVLAEYAVAGVAEEPVPAGIDGTCVGAGLQDAFDQTLAVLPEGARVDRLYGDLNGSRYRADELGFTLAKCSNRFVDLQNINLPTIHWGDLGAATGCAQLALACGDLAHHDQRTALIWNSGEHRAFRATLLLARP
ncbi:beta-ketoacyl synthase N-terminal-like domain-containing protein [Acanthopleuribacter pedis]|uniref:Beta-ketoacyl synthase-like N-terminal domain-containing protein n=1 Tax=Acanthopleuribacter pedis TaxID=442870 RepID=A0A8J7QDT2_9BACT|nr:beta-ketoacyl synthase N-terminal-like domain-containing protein [Acanthopleuribacter pedis]MBO1322314.1 hypothetical protein [Acanthopleuribacter pedis]